MPDRQINIHVNVTGTNLGQLADIASGLSTIAHNLERLGLVSATVNPQLVQTKANLAGVGGALAANTKHLNQNTSSLVNNIAKVIAWSAATAVVYKSLQLLGTASDDIRKVDYAMAGLIKIMDQSTATNKVSRNSIKDLGVAVRELAVQYGELGSDAVAATTEWARTQQSFKGITEGVKASLLAQAVAEMDVKDATGYLIAALNQYEQPATRATDVLDSWNQLSNVAAVRTVDLAQSVAKAGSVYNDLSVSMQELNGITTVLVASTKKSGNEIGNALKTLGTYVYRPETIAALKEAANIDIKDVGTGQLKGFMPIMKELAAGWNSYTDAQKRAISNTVAGARRVTEFNLMMKQMPEILKMTTAAYQGHGSALREQAIYMDTIQKKSDQVRSAFENLAYTTNGPLIWSTKLFLDITRYILVGLAKEQGLVIALGIALAGLAVKMLIVDNIMKRSLSTLTKSQKWTIALTAATLLLAGATALYSGIKGRAIEQEEKSKRVEQSSHDIAIEALKIKKSQLDVVQQTLLTLEKINDLQKSEAWDKMSPALKQERIAEKAKLTAELSKAGGEVEILTGRKNQTTSQVRAALPSLLGDVAKETTRLTNIYNSLEKDLIVGKKVFDLLDSEMTIYSKSHAVMINNAMTPLPSGKFTNKDKLAITENVISRGKKEGMTADQIERSLTTIGYEKPKPLGTLESTIYNMAGMPGKRETLGKNINLDQFLEKRQQNLEAIAQMESDRKSLKPAVTTVVEGEMTPEEEEDAIERVTHELERRTAVITDAARRSKEKGQATSEADTIEIKGSQSKIGYLNAELNVYKDQEKVFEKLSDMRGDEVRKLSALKTIQVPATAYTQSLKDINDLYESNVARLDALNDREIQRAQAVGSATDVYNAQKKAIEDNIGATERLIESDLTKGAFDEDNANKLKEQKQSLDNLTWSFDNITKLNEEYDSSIALMDALNSREVQRAQSLGTSTDVYNAQRTAIEDNISATEKLIAQYKKQGTTFEPFADTLKQQKQSLEDLAWSYTNITEPMKNMADAMRDIGIASDYMLAKLQANGADQVALLSARLDTIQALMDATPQGDRTKDAYVQLQAEQKRITEIGIPSARRTSWQSNVEKFYGKKSAYDTDKNTGQKPSQDAEQKLRDAQQVYSIMSNAIPASQLGQYKDQVDQAKLNLQVAKRSELLQGKEKQYAQYETSLFGGNATDMLRTDEELAIRHKDNVDKMIVKNKELFYGGMADQQAVYDRQLEELEEKQKQAGIAITTAHNQYAMQVMESYMDALNQVQDKWSTIMVDVTKGDLGGFASALNAISDEALKKSMENNPLVKKMAKYEMRTGWSAEMKAEEDQRQQLIANMTAVFDNGSMTFGDVFLSAGMRVADAMYGATQGIKPDVTGVATSKDVMYKPVFVGPKGTGEDKPLSALNRFTMTIPSIVMGQMANGKFASGGGAKAVGESLAGLLGSGVEDAILKKYGADSAQMNKWAGTGSAMAGATGNTIAAAQAGNNNQAIGSGIGAVAGGILGSVIPGVGTAIGIGVGGAIGGAIGGAVGDDDKNAKPQEESLRDVLSDTIAQGSFQSAANITYNVQNTNNLEFMIPDAEQLRRVVVMLKNANADFNSNVSMAA